MKPKNFTLSIKSLFVILILLFFIAITVQYYILQQSRLRLAKSLGVFYSQIQNGELASFNTDNLSFKEKQFLKSNGAVLKDGLLVVKDGERLKSLKLKDDIIFRFGADLILVNIIFDLILIWVALYFYFKIFVAITKATATIELSANGRFVPERLPDIDVEGVDRLIDNFKNIYVNYLKTEQEVKRKSQFESLGLISARIIHDLKNTFVYLTVMLHRAKNNENFDEVKDILRAVDAKINDLKVALEDVLYALRDGKNFKIEDIDIEVLKSGFEREYSHLCKELGIDFKTEFDENLMGRTISVNPFQIKSAIDNLLNNAVKVLEGKKVGDKRIVLGFKLKNGNMEIEVWDNAGGMSPDIRENIFKRFNSESDGGIGLGLNTVKEYIELNGGSVDLNFKDGMTEFLIKIPLKNGGGNENNS